jgi:hypothetical protein
MPWLGATWHGATWFGAMFFCGIENEKDWNSFSHFNDTGWL